MRNLFFRAKARIPHHHGPIGLRYALRILIGTLAAWKLFSLFGDRYPIWAVISVVMVSEIEMKATFEATKSRVAHTATGCAVGLIFLATLGTGLWQLSVAAAAAALVSFYLVHAGGNWRTAPVASLIVMATGVEHSSTLA
ncbi:MAG: FUSC family protein, partial [Candidatus Acidiferrales bacterium]